MQKLIFFHMQRQKSTFIIIFVANLVAYPLLIGGIGLEVVYGEAQTSPLLFILILQVIVGLLQLQLTVQDLTKDESLMLKSTPYSFSYLLTSHYLYIVLTMIVFGLFNSLLIILYGNMIDFGIINSDIQIPLSWISEHISAVLVHQFVIDIGLLLLLPVFLVLSSKYTHKESIVLYAILFIVLLFTFWLRLNSLPADTIVNKGDLNFWMEYLLNVSPILAVIGGYYFTCRQYEKLDSWKGYTLISKVSGMSILIGMLLFAYIL